MCVYMSEFVLVCICVYMSEFVCVYMSEFVCVYVCVCEPVTSCILKLRLFQDPLVTAILPFIKLLISNL